MLLTPRLRHRVCVCVCVCVCVSVQVADAVVSVCEERKLSGRLEQACVACALDCGRVLQVGPSPPSTLPHTHTRYIPASAEHTCVTPSCRTLHPPPWVWCRRC